MENDNFLLISADADYQIVQTSIHGDVGFRVKKEAIAVSAKTLWAIERARHILAGGDRPQPGGDFKLVRVRHEPQRYEVKHD